MKSGRHDCRDLLDRFEELARQHERMCCAVERYPMGRKKIEELNFLRDQIKVLLRTVCENED